MHELLREALPRLERDLKGMAWEGEDIWHEMTGDPPPPCKRWELLPGWVRRARGSGRLPGGGGLEPGKGSESKDQGGAENNLELRKA